jgi:choline kinase
MRATILGAGVGRRLERPELPPKVMLSFGGDTLLARHIAILRDAGITTIDVVVGYRAEAVRQEISRIGADDIVRTHLNPDYQRGSIVSLWTLREAYLSGEPVLFMDGDVLYDQRMIERLITTQQETCFLLDRATEEGEDPVKLCMRDGVVVDFHKRPSLAHDWWGEWIGFTRFSPDAAAKVAAALDRHVSAGRLDEIYEEAFRDVLLSEPPGTFQVEDITGLPWVEIDFPEDLAKAECEIFPRLLPLPGSVPVGLEAKQRA